MAQVEKLIESKLVQATKMIEDQVDNEIEKLEHMDEDDFEALRLKRREALKKHEAKKRDWLTKGHGEYAEITEEKEFFNACKDSENVVCHFYRNSTFRCKIVDKHLSILAKQHLETKFCKLDIEKSPFLTDRLKIRVLPTIVLCKSGVMKDYIKGFDDLGGTDEFTTEMMEWRIAQAAVINYSGDITVPPVKKQPPVLQIFGSSKKNIRGGNNADSDSSDDE